MDTINEISYWYNLIVTYLVTGLTWIFEHFRDFAWIVRMAAICLSIFIFLILASFFKVFKTAWESHKWRRVDKKLTKRYGEAVEFIFSPAASNNIGRDEMLELLKINPSEAIPHKLLKDWRERMTMTRIIYRSRISENAQLHRRRNLHVILNIFNLVDFLEEVIIKDKMHYKVEALHMLRAFKTPTNQWIANQLFNSKRRRVKRLAMHASIMSSANTDLEYFESDFFGKNFCLYDEIQLSYVLRRRISAKRKIPNLAHWASIQEDPEAKAMFIRMMRQFNQLEHCSELEEMFHHNSDGKLIEEIARTWGYLKYYEGEELMSDMMLTQPDNGKVAIMHALTRLNTGKSLNTLLDGYRNSGSPHVRFEALRCIYWYGDIGRAKFNELRAAALEQEKMFFDFFDNDLTAKELPLVDLDLDLSDYSDNLYSVV